MGWALKIETFWALPFRRPLERVGPRHGFAHITCYSKIHLHKITSVWRLDFEGENALLGSLEGVGTHFARCQFGAQKKS